MEDTLWDIIIKVLLIIFSTRFSMIFYSDFGSNGLVASSKALILPILLQQKAKSEVNALILRNSSSGQK